MNPLELMLPVLETGEVVIPQTIRVEGDDMFVPLHFFLGDGRSTRVEARFDIESADETTMAAALSQAVDQAREALK